ncbi:MAG TPA: DUF4114 domain-containing protein, partial [Methylophaga sp.]|nr:DUF4114 domain-containing protein [Methylophaga sp.]
KDTVPVTVTGYTPDQIGFFIIPNGDSNSFLEDNTPVSFSFVNGQWQVFSGTTPIVGSGAHVYFDDAGLNKDSQQHVVDNGLTGNQNWEDKPIPSGDKDFNDVNINVEWKVTEGTGKLLTVDETALADGDDATTASATVALAGSFAITAGADGLGSVGYELGLVAQDADSGLVDTGSNNAVLLRTNAAGDIEGYVADGVVFTLTVNTATGEVTLTQLRAVVHGNPADSDESTSPATINDGLIVLTATVTDGDGDTASDSIDLGTLIAFEDDGPTAVADNTITTNEDTPIVINVLANDNLGADNATVTNHTQATNGTVVLNDDGTFTYTPSANYSGADSFSYTLTDGDGDTSTALVSIGVTPVADAPTLLMSVGAATTIVGDNLVINGSFEDVSGKNANGGKVTDQPIADGGLVSRISIPGWTTVSGPAMEPHDQNHAGVGTTDGVHYMDLGGTPGNTSIEQKFSSLVAGQTYQLSFDFRDKAAMQESGQAGQDSGVMNVVWNGAVIATVQGNNTDSWDTLTINVEATGNDSLVYAEVGDSDDNWGIALDNVQLHGVAYSYELSVLGGLTDVDGSESLSGVTISNLPDGATITSDANADGTYEPGTLTITSDHQLSATEVNNITGEITSTDGASTATTVETAKVVFEGLDATGETANLLIEGDGSANKIIGGAGDDIIFGGAGNDMLTGGAGSDTFVWNQADLGTAGTAALDTVTDFDVNHDVLNLSDLLSDASHTIEGISTGTDNHLQLNINDTSGNTVQQIDLQGVSAGTDVNATLNSLIASGAIKDGI